MTSAISHLKIVITAGATPPLPPAPPSAR